MKEKIKLVFVVLVIAIFALYMRAVVESYLCVSLANEHAEQGNYQAAITEYRKAIGWYAPGNPINAEAYTRGLELAKSKFPDANSRLAVYRELRRGLYGSRNFLNNNSSPLQEIDQLITELAPPSGFGGVEELNRPEINYTMQIIAGLSFLGWVGAVFLMIFRGFNADGTIVRSEIFKRLIVWAVFFVGWLFALSK